MFLIILSDGKNSFAMNKWNIFIFDFFLQISVLYNEYNVWIL